MGHLDWKTVVHIRKSYEDKFSSSQLLFALLPVVYTSPEEKMNTKLTMNILAS